jgi:O-antigen/teichoic acid export membrane protein
MAESLKEKTIKGVSWSFVDNILSKGITFLVGLVLARLLTPKEYGIIGIVSIFIAVFNSIVDSGFSSALVRKNDATDVDYNTVFYTNLVISVVLFAVLFLCAPAISKFFHQPELVSLTRVMSVIVLINAFSIIQRTLLVKKVDFKTQTKISIIASSVSGVIGIGMAFMKFGVWSLAGQQISRQLLNSIFLWVYNKWRPHKQFSISHFKELFSFGWKLLVSGLINTIWKQIYLIVIGKCYSTETLGQYSRADQFQSIFSSNLTSIIQRVSYPVLSSIQDERERLKQSYKKLIKVTMLVTFTCMLGLAAIAKPLVLVLIGDKWLESVKYLQIICFVGMLYPLHAINLNMLQVQGRSDLFLILEIIKKAIAVIPVLLGIFINIYWMLYGSVITGFISYFLNSYYSGKELHYSSMEQIKDILPSFCIASVMAIVVYCISLINISPFILLPVQLITGFVIVIGLSEIGHRYEYLQVKEITISIINKIKHGRK